MLLETNADQYHGKTISHFEDEYGLKLSSLQMIESLVIVFTDGSKICMSKDWRGSECYFSQVEGVKQ